MNAGEAGQRESGRLKAALDAAGERLAGLETFQRGWAYYQTLGARDQRALWTLGLVLLTLALVFAVLLPLQQQASQARDRYRQGLEDLAWMEAHRHEVVRAAPVARDPDASLLSLATRSASGHGLSVRRFDPIGGDGISLSLERVEFDRALAWLAELMRLGVRIEEFSADRREPAGHVDLRVVLRG